MKFSILFLLSVISLSLSAASVSITGGIKGFEKKIISANKVEDYITNNQLVVAEQAINSGKFSLVFDLNETQQIFLKIEDKTTSLFVEPGKTYNIGLSYNAQANQANAFDKYLDISFIFPDPSEANSLIKSFNKDYQKFFLENYNMIVLKKAKKETDAFIAKQNNNTNYQNNQFVKNYVKYTLANLEDIANKPRESLYNEYLGNQTILLHHKEYMNFFMQYYKSDFDKLTLTKKGQTVLKAITFDEDLEKTIKEIKRVKSFKSDEFTELYLCYGLYEVFHSKRVNQDASLKILDLLAEKASTSKNKLLAKNVKQKLQLYGKNQPAPDFKLKDLDGKIFQLSDFKGKIIYLNFWANWSIPSLREMQIINSLHKKYENKVHFISINVDEGTESLKMIQSQKNYPWTMLHYGDDYKVRERFDVRTVPTYFLIDKKGKMLTPFAPGPTDIEKVLYELK